MELYLIRHGQSTNNARWETLDGRSTVPVSDPTLTEKGVRQAELLAEFLAFPKENEEDFWRDPQNRHGFGLTHVYCSLMKRAIHTGSIISRRLGLPLRGLPDAHEVGGIFRELVVDDLVETRRGGKEDSSLPLLRAQEVLNWIKERHMGSDDRLAIVTHGGFSNYLMRAMLQISPEEPDNRKLGYRLIYNNCAISRFDFIDNRVFMVYNNRADFLTDELIT